jgi:hypothetical protein
MLGFFLLSIPAVVAPLYSLNYRQKAAKSAERKDLRLKKSYNARKM